MYGSTTIKTIIHDLHRPIATTIKRLKPVDRLTMLPFYICLRMENYRKTIFRMEKKSTIYYVTHTI